MSFFGPKRKRVSAVSMTSNGSSVYPHLRLTHQTSGEVLWTMQKMDTIKAFIGLDSVFLLY